MISFVFRNAIRLRLNDSVVKPPLVSLSRWSRWTAHQSANSLSPDPSGRRAAETFSSARPLPKDLQEFVEKLLKMDRESLNRMDMTPLSRSARAMVSSERFRRKAEDKLKSSSSSSSNSGRVDSVKQTVSETVGKLLSTTLNSSLEPSPPIKSDKGDTGIKSISNSRTTQPTKAKKNSIKGRVIDGYHLHSELAKVGSTFGYKLVYDPDLQGSQSSVDQRDRNMSALFTCSNGCQDPVRPHLPRTWRSSVVFTEFWFSSGYEGLSHPVRYRSSSHPQRCSQCNHFVEPELFLEKYIAIAMRCIDRWIHGETDEVVGSEPWRHHKRRCNACQQGRCRASVERLKPR